MLLAIFNGSYSKIYNSTWHWFQAVTAKVSTSKQRTQAAETKLMRQEAMKSIKEYDNKLKRKDEEITNMKTGYEKRVREPPIN